MATMTTPAPSAGAAGGLATWLSIGVLLAYIAVLVWVACGRPPVRASVLHALMTGSQTVARGVGTLGLHAEAAYRRQVSPDGSATT